MSTVTIHDKEFERYISADVIRTKVQELAHVISRDFENKNPLFIGVLNGSFRFASDLFANMDAACEIEFVKVNSYEGTETKGKVKEMIGINGDLSGRHLIVVEDIVDTGHTLDFLLEVLAKTNAAKISIATLLLKPNAYHGKVKLDYIGFDIPNLFVVGYGLDYDGLGRNLNDIYQIKS